MWASVNGHMDTVQLLADLGADVNEVSNSGWTGA